jgi:hypothetical protein
VKLQEKKLATTHIVQDFFYQALAFVTFISKASVPEAQKRTYVLVK